MNRIYIEQRKIQSKRQKQDQFEILICDDYGQGMINVREISQDKRINKFYDDDKELIRDLLKIYYQDGFGDNITDILDRWIRDELSIRIDDVYYNYEDLRELIEKIEVEYREEE